MIGEAGLASRRSPDGDGAALCWFTLAEAHWTSGHPGDAWISAQQAAAAVDDDDEGDSAVVATAVSEAAFVGSGLNLPGVDACMARLERLATTYDDPSPDTASTLPSHPSLR